MPNIPKLRVISQTADIHIQHEGVTHTERDTRVTDLEDQRLSLPDILLAMQDECGIPLPLCRDIPYCYDPKTNSYRRIEDSAYWLDANGYLHFKTGYTGEIIISEDELEKR